MAEILPFRAWRYHQLLNDRIGQLTSPLFDVVSQEQREALYKVEHNSIHLSVPKGLEPAKEAAKLLRKWKKEGVLQQDPLPALYPYYQYFTLPGSKKELVRKGFICMIKAYEWPERVILRHENTIPDAVNDRIELLEETMLNVSATHGLYSDLGFELEGFMDEAVSQPLYETEDYQGVRDVLGCIQDAAVIKRFIHAIRGKQIILADGHHRYESSLVYRQRAKAVNPDHRGAEGYNFHMMYLTNMESQDLRILPTHRLIHGLAPIDWSAFMQNASEYFAITPVEDASELDEVIMGKKWTFGLLSPNGSFKLKLKPEVHPLITWHFPSEVKELDLTVMHYFILEKLLGIPGKEQRSSKHISFQRNFAQCLSKVEKGDVQMALITNEISIEEVKSVCNTGFTMPQKSTYFYPKTICGFLFGSVNQHESTLPFDFSL
jgi:uncharacterized protein (DUF1015 family)